MDNENITMEEVLNTIPEHVTFVKGDMPAYRYSLKACKSMAECLKFFIPGLYISDDKIKEVANRNFPGVTRKEFYELALTDEELLNITRKRIEHFMRKRSGFVFENPEVKEGLSELYYKVSYNLAENNPLKPKTIFNFSLFKGKTFIEEQKNIKDDNVSVSLLSKVLTQKYPEIYPKLYCLYYVNLFNFYARENNGVLKGHENGLQRKLHLIGKKAENLTQVVFHGVTGFKFDELEDIPPKDYDAEEEQ